ncbi:MAG: oligosaccharide flippase family protein [Trueperaceae bacterium]|nr:oligosaccharide flippase family protein [Trueperaceae bacterium]MCC6309875.1 oligosaccharide flippase family protein [Trueperaceae bacterium]MCW5818328.1 oligosaccharide flippase family protein [Trueperaceae bacterium]
MPDSNLPPRDFGKRLGSSFAYFGTVVVGQLFSFLVLPFVTRALSPEAYGTYALALAISSLVSMVATSWIRNVALTLYYERLKLGRTKGFFIGLVSLQAGGFTLLYLLTLLGMVMLGRTPEELRVMLSAGGMALVGDVAVLSTMLLRAERRTIAFGVAEVGGALLRFGLTLLGIALGYRTAEMLFNVAALGYLVAGVVAVCTLWPRLQGSARIDRAGVREVLAHGPGALPYSIADWAERLADRLIIEGFLGTAAVGIYSIAYTVGERTIGALTNAVFMMAWPNILEASKAGSKREAALAVREAQELFVWFSLGPTLFLVAYGPFLLDWFTGASYSSGGSIVPIVAASMWLGGLTTYWNRHMEIDKRYGLLSTIRLVGAAFNVGLNFVLIPTMGIIGAAWATLGNRVLNGLIFYLTRDRQLVSIPVTTLARAGFLSLVAWLVSYWLPVSELWRCLVFIAVYAPPALLALWAGARRS